MCLSSICVRVCKGECIVSSVSVMQLEETDGAGSSARPIVCAIDPLIKVSVFKKNVKNCSTIDFRRK